MWIALALLLSTPSAEPHAVPAAPSQGATPVPAVDTARASTPATVGAAAPPELVEGVALIWGGGRDAEAARASLADFDRRSASWFDDDEVGWPEGMPRIVESGTVAGLNPGFTIVLLGVCKPDAFTDTLVKAFDALEPSFYAKPVRWPRPPQDQWPCPRAGIGTLGSSNNWQLAGTAETTTAQGTLTVVAFEYSYGGCTYEDRHYKVIASLHKKSAPSVSIAFRDKETFASLDKIEVARRGTIVIDANHVPSPCWGGTSGSLFARTITVTAADGAIKLREDDADTETVDCGPDPWATAADVEAAADAETADDD